MFSTALTAVALVPVLVAGFAGRLPPGQAAQVVPPGTQQQSAPPAPDRAPASKQSPDVPATKDPDARLFVELTAATQVARQSAGKPKVLCGLTVVEVDPNIDPKIIVPAKPGGVDPKIRRISPPVCRE